MGGGIRRGPTSFRFENMWLKVDDFNGLLRGWWQGIEVRGRASFRLAYKMKDGVESERSLSIAETKQKKEAKDAFYKWVLMEEVHWRQKSRELWLKKGDRNTGYFHRMANAHRRNNSLDRIMINGELLTEDQEVRNGIVNAFQKLLSEEPGWRADIEGLQLNQLNSREAEDLEMPFSEEEIHFALMEMRGDKAPGLDGFTVAFWQDCWDFVKEEVVDLFKEFFEHGSFAKSLTPPFWSLFLRKEELKTWGTSGQSACLGILDASLVANEVIDYWYKRKEKGMICKLDIEKAYDSINWKFLMKVLRKMGFGSRWIGLDVVVYFYCQILHINQRVPAGFFSNSKGLRQGDPLSPYLFVLGMEVLSTLIRRAGEGGFILGCRLRGRGGEELTVSHLLFADDALIFCKVRREQLINLSWILAWFEAASGLRINLAKRVLIPMGEVDELEELAAELGCRLGALPTVYLGLPLGAQHKTSSSWDGVEERMRRRLAQWKRQYISKGRRITLIKSTLASIPIYLLSLIRIPKAVTKRIEKIQRDFLWGGSLEGKVHLINWKVVCSPKEEGGVKYGQEGCEWRTKEVCGPYGVGLWKEIMKEADWCWESIDFKVGKGNRVLFWMDKWCAMRRFLKLFLSCLPWRIIRMPKFVKYGILAWVKEGFRISPEEDLVRWKREGNEVFGAKGAYKMLSGSSADVFSE
ncbi:LINE-1 reverse transcriptase-like [Vitis vinifera]|uniref:LINE-1 reverse transcriptase-like n=1 Tax=Vitis vinifera TaxID=29760 RepID=A0A438IUT2_VITVI|nr:LINE-1 reverse transcriptase-like [Vitis vinifera]